VDGPGVAAPADVPVGASTRVAGAPDVAELFPLPRIEPAGPSPAGLALAVRDWHSAPDPLVPLYLRRPDAKTLAERAAGRGR